MRTRNLFTAFLFLFIGSLLGGCSGSHADSETQAQRKTPAPPSLDYIGAWGVKGSDPGQLDDPTGIAVDAVGDSYIPDAATQFVQKFDATGTPLLSFQDTLLKHPQSITLDHGGGIYITDAARGSCFVFFPEGDRYRELHLRSRPNAEDMLSVAVDDEGDVHVLDSNAGTVFTYARFQLARTWKAPANSGGGGKLRGRIVAGPGDSLYIADPGANRFLRFGRDGVLLAEITPQPQSGAPKLSEEFTVSANAIFGMDADGRMLHVWTLDGKPKLDRDLAPELLANGGQAKRYPPALAISPRGELLVLDAPEARVLRYHIGF